MKDFQLESQFRVNAGSKYIRYIYNLLHTLQTKKEHFREYDLKLFEKVDDFIKEVQEKERKEGLSRFLAGYGWKWVSKKDKTLNDIRIENREFKWNINDKDWIRHADVFKNEVGCIHTIQGYDLNYAGVIFGPEIGFDDENEEIIIKKENYHDIKGITKEPHELKEFILSIYFTLLTRGIKGTYVYVYDEKLSNYLKKYIDVYQRNKY